MIFLRIENMKDCGRLHMHLKSQAMTPMHCFYRLKNRWLNKIVLYSMHKNYLHKWLIQLRGLK